MKTQGKRFVITGILLMIIFIIWTVLVQTVDTGYVTETGTTVGFYTINNRFHRLTGVNMALYTLTDWLGLVPVAVCTVFGFVGLVQMIKRKSLLKVDADIILLAFYYIAVMLSYIIFEICPINYRPVLIAGRLEASYPSSTTLLVMGVMPTLVFQAQHRLKSKKATHIIRISAICFTLFMVTGRLICGVHWLTDIIGGILLASGLFYIYKGVVILYCQKN